MEGKVKGSLYIVSTPIGNLADFTYRSVEILRSAHLIGAEDTRRTRILMNHYDIKTPVSSYNSYNQTKKGKYFIELLNQGQDLALVSDAGTPGVSDPLYNLVQAAVEEGIAVQAAPGPSAVLAALTVSGLPMDRFLFEGFLPRKKGRTKKLEELASQKRTLVIFESPHRIGKTLQDLLRFFGNRKACLAREMTKLHEEVIRDDLEGMTARFKDRNWKGEITLVVAGAERKEKCD